MFTLTVSYPIFHHSTDGFLGTSTKAVAEFANLVDAVKALDLCPEQESFDDAAYGIRFPDGKYHDWSTVRGEQGPYFCSWDGTRVFGNESHYALCTAPF